MTNYQAVSDYALSVIKDSFKYIGKDVRLVIEDSDTDEAYIEIDGTDLGLFIKWDIPNSIIEVDEPVPFYTATLVKTTYNGQVSPPDQDYVDLNTPARTLEEVVPILVGKYIEYEVLYYLEGLRDEEECKWRDCLEKESLNRGNND